MDLVIGVVLGEVFGVDGLVVLAVVALLFGGSKLPQLARSLGAARGEFERGMRDGETPSGDGSGDDHDLDARLAETEARAAAAEAEVARLRAGDDPLD